MSTIVSDKYYAVIGLGVTGLSVARYMQRKGLRFVVLDSRENPPGLKSFKEGFPDVPLYLGEFDQDILLNAYSVVLSPGVSRREKAVAACVEAGVRITSDVEMFLQENSRKVVGVTGSNGKSTVVTLLGEIARAEGIKVIVGGNIGTPVLDLLDVDYSLAILELSSFQLENIKKADLDVACILNVSLDHIDRHLTMEAYFKAKQRIYFGAKSVVYNLDDRLSIPPAVNRVKRAGFALSKPTEENEAQYWYDTRSRELIKNNKLLMPYSDMRIKGLHNVANALAVFAICDFIEISSDAVARKLLCFNGLPHRCQWVAEDKREQRAQLTFVNDSKATNVGATEAALLGLKGDYENIYLIAGGDAKGADFSSLAKVIREHVRALILIGRDADHIAQAVGEDFTIYRALNMKAAVSLAVEIAEGVGLVLLSPACASFDMYSGYEARGEDFVHSVQEVLAG